MGKNTFSIYESKFCLLYRHKYVKLFFKEVVCHKGISFVVYTCYNFKILRQYYEKCKIK